MSKYVRLAEGETLRQKLGDERYERMLERQRQRRKENPDKAREYHRQWRAANPDKVKEYAAQPETKRRAKLWREKNFVKLKRLRKYVRLAEGETTRQKLGDERYERALEANRRWRERQ